MGTPPNPPGSGQKFRILLLNAMTRPMAAAVVALTIIVALNVGYWFFLLGAAFYVVIVLFTLRDANESKKVLNEVLYPERARKLDPSALKGGYRTAIQQALDRKAQIEGAVAQTGDAKVREALAASTGDLDELTGTIYDIALKAQSLESSIGQSRIDPAALARDMKALEARVGNTHDEFTRSQYQATLDGKRQQLQNYNDTVDALRRWQSQLDHALSTLDTILSQVLRIRSTEVLSLSEATDPVSHSLKEEVEALKATSDALDTVYGLSR